MPILNYIRTMRKKTIATLLITLLIAGSLIAESITFGREDRWTNVAATENLIRRPGRQSYDDFELSLFCYEPDTDTELLLQFDEEPLSDVSGHYEVIAAEPEISTGTHRTGQRGLLVDRRNDSIELVPGPGSLFRPGVEWGSFTIEFWLYPVVLTDGDVLVRWYAREGADRDFRQQELTVVVKDRRLLFRFVNFFQPPDGGESTISLLGTRNPIPRQWSHHMIRFDDQSALLEYLVDGQPVTMTHASETGTEDGSVFFPRAALYSDGGLTLPGQFIGALDEFRITRRVVEEPGLDLYPKGGGRVATEVVDLGSPRARVDRIDALTNEPGLSEVFLYYRLADVRFEDTDAFDAPEWIPFQAGRAIDDGFGRFLQIQAELFADTAEGLTPSLSEISVDYEADPPPLPPTGLSAVPMDGAVLLQWTPVREQDIEGYLVYYGDQSGRYFGSDSSSGISPIDVGPVNSTVLEGLTNGTLYYFAVSAYDVSRNTVGLQLSREVVARPARVYR
jgi:hypothetical protein